MKAVATFFGLTILLAVAVRSNGQDTTKNAGNGVGPADIENQRAFAAYRAANGQRSPMPEFFMKEYPHGSPFLSNSWMQGRVQLSTELEIPHPQEILYFNYDKMRMKVITTTPDGQLKAYSANDVLSFVLVDSNNRLYSFEKVPEIGSAIFVTSLVKSDKGFSLYRRIITRMKEANYMSIGYSSTGKRYDTYVDEYEYYLVSSATGEVQKFFLNRHKVEKVFRAHIDKLDLIDKQYNHILNENAIVDLVEAINGQSMYH